MQAVSTDGAGLDVLKHAVVCEEAAGVCRAMQAGRRLYIMQRGHCSEYLAKPINQFIRGTCEAGPCCLGRSDCRGERWMRRPWQRWQLSVPLLCFAVPSAKSRNSSDAVLARVLSSLHEAGALVLLFGEVGFSLFRRVSPVQMTATIMRELQ